MNERLTRFSPDRKYRYALWRYLGGEVELFSSVDPRAKLDTSYVAFICLNPSTADETIDDPTIRRCCGFVRDWGYKWFCMLNLFAFRATDPRDMINEVEPVGLENDRILLEIASKAGLVVAAWGVHGTLNHRCNIVSGLLEAHRVRLYCLGKTKEGHPKHPLYLPANLKAIPFN